MTVRKTLGSHTLTPADSSAAHVRAMIGETRIVEARALLNEALEQHPQDPELLSLQEVISPPRGRLRGFVDADRSREFAWIMANRNQYRRRWVAVDGSRLVADAASFIELQSRIKDLGNTPLIHWIE